ncbi:MAG: hypothetical protein ABS920_06810 [Sporosarcina sp.]
MNWNLYSNCANERYRAYAACKLAVSPTYWPHAWPSPKPVTLTVYKNEKTYLSLPIREPKAIDDELKPFEHPETAAVIEREILREANRTREIRHNTITGVSTLDDFSDEGARRIVHNGVEYGSTNRNVYTIEEGNPLSAKVQCDWTLTVGRGEWQTSLASVSLMTADEDHFYLTNHLIAYEGEKEVFNKIWKTAVPRDFV